jgi:L-ornithine N5-oxygenase
MSIPAPTSSSVDDVLDVVGIGFGPSNLSLAIALAEHNGALAEHNGALAEHNGALAEHNGATGRPLTARLVERQATFGWHRGMLIEDTTMQVSFLKDLVTLRNPCSPYSFLSYLHSRDRMVDFINYGSVFPTRMEFHDYLEWVADAFAEQVEYGVEVTSLRPVRSDDGGIEHISVVMRRPDGSTHRLLARNVVLAAGLTGRVPTGVTLGRRIWHSYDLLMRMPELEGTSPQRVSVVGAGQSAAEVVDYLHRTFPTAEVCAVFARYGYSPADDSSFANRIFDPDAVEEFYCAPEDVKAQIMSYHSNTNYSVVDPELIDGLYRRHYHERVAGKERLRFLNVTRVTATEAVGDKVNLTVESLIDGERQELPSDLVVFATGYRPRDPIPLLGELAAVCDRDEAGRLAIRRDYRVGTDPTMTARIYIQGATEHTHGITSTLLSNVAVRSGEIVASIADTEPSDEHPPGTRPDGVGEPPTSGSRTHPAPARHPSVPAGAAS